MSDELTLVPTAGALKLAGRLDRMSVAKVRLELHEAIDGGAGDLRVDVSGLEYVDASGVAVLVGAHRRAARNGRRMLIEQATPGFLRTLAVTRLHRVLNVTPALPGSAALLVR